jgi:hypothetical protein
MWAARRDALGCTHWHRARPDQPLCLQVLRERLDVPMLVDAGLGLPSHACQVMEWGFDGVLLNTAVALAQDPVAMAGALPTRAGRTQRPPGRRHGSRSKTPPSPAPRCWAPRSGTTPEDANMSLTTQHAMAQAIMRHTPLTFAGFAPQPVPAPDAAPCPPGVPVARSPGLQRAGLHRADARCVAHAWQARSARTGL